MVCFSSSKATAEDAVLTTHILARLLHSIAAVIGRSPCMLCTQLAGSGNSGLKGLHLLQSRTKPGASKTYKVSDNLNMYLQENLTCQHKIGKASTWEWLNAQAICATETLGMWTHEQS
jgi:hypothetical protein